MEIEVLSDGGREQELYEDLENWLKEEPQLRAAVRAQRGRADPGALGAGLIDALTVSVGAGGAITVVAHALGTWLRHRGDNRVRLKIRRSAKESEVIVDTQNCSASDLERLLRQIQDGGTSAPS